jgi:hypothetical protein
MISPFRMYISVVVAEPGAGVMHFEDYLVFELLISNLDFLLPLICFRRPAPKSITCRQAVPIKV